MTTTMTTMTRTYKRMGGFATTAGTTFEVKVTALTYLRALNEGKEFELGTNVDHAGAFDDVVLRVRAHDSERWDTFFIQLKHREKKSLTRNMLLSDGPSFSLVKYYESFLAIKASMEEAVRNVLFEGDFSDACFIIMTNAPGYANLGDKCQENLELKKVKRYIGSDEGSVYRFDPDREENEDVLLSLGELGTPADRKAFLKQFYLMSGQCTDEQLDELIKQELIKWEASVSSKHAATPVDAAQLFDRVIADLLTWCELRTKQGLVTVLNEAGTLLHDARTRVFVEATSVHGMESQALGVSYGAGAVTSLGDAMRNTLNTVIRVEASELTTRLTCAKVFQVIGRDHLLFFAAGSLQGVDGALAWHLDNVKREYLVVSVSDADAKGDNSEMILELLKRFCPVSKDNKEESKKKKSKGKSEDNKVSGGIPSGVKRILVIVASQGNLLVDKLVAELQSGCDSIADVFQFSQLDETIRQTLLVETVIPVQGHPTTLLNLFDDDPVKADEFMDATTTTEFLVGDKRQPIGPDLDQDIPWYIPRIMEQTTDLKTSLLQIPSLEESIHVVCEEFEDVWSLLAQADSSINTKKIEDIVELVSETSEVNDNFREKIFIGEDFRLGAFACNYIGLRCGQADSVDAVRVRFGPRDDEDTLENNPKCFLFVPAAVDRTDADLLADFNESKHFLHLRDSRLRWIRSRCSVTLFQAYLDETRASSAMVRETVAVEDRVVLLCAEPGMGKSTLMVDVAKETKAAHPEALVLAISLIEHVNLFVNGLHSDPAAFLMKAAGLETGLQQLWFKLALATGNFVAILDGFEEVCSKYEQQCRLLLTGLLQTKTRKVWITSRNTKKEDLEDLLCILATKLRAFNVEDQKTFLKSYWAEAMAENNISDLGGERLDTFIAKVIAKTEGAIKDREKDFMKIPLHTMMMAEVFKPDLADLARTVDSADKLHLIDLFDRYCKIKIEVYLRDKLQLGCEHPLYDTTFTQTEESCQDAHGLAALMAIFDDEDIDELTPKTIRESCLSLTESFQSGKEKTGFIVNVLDGRPRFIHRVFTEYFCAKWFAKHLAPNVTFLKHRLYSSEFGVIREMFDYTLAKGCPLHTAVLKEDLEEVQRLLNGVEDTDRRDHGGRTALHLAASLGTSDSDEDNDRKKRILDLLVLSNADEADDVFARSPLEYAAATSTWSAVDRLLPCTVNTECLSTLTNAPARDSMLTFASTHDLSELMAFCLANHLPVNHSLERAGTMLSVACANGSVRVAMLLLEGGADVLAKDPTGTSPLQHAAGTGSAALVEAILGKITDLNAKAAYIRGSDAFGENALQSATRKGFVDVVHVLLQALPDSKDKAEFVKASDRFGDNPLLIAVRKGNAEIVAMLLKAIPKPTERLAYLKSADVFGDTSLRLACKNGYKEVAELLLREIAKPNDRLESITAGDVNGNNALIIATTRGDANIVRTLLQAVPDPKARLRCVQGASMEGETPLRLAAAKGDGEVVEAILSALEDSQEKMAYIRSCGARGECSLVIATRFGHSEVVRIILESISDGAERLKYIGNCWPERESLLVFATRVGNMETVDAILRAIPEGRRKKHVQECWASSGENLMGLAIQLKQDGIVKIVKQYFT